MLRSHLIYVFAAILCVVMIILFMYLKIRYRFWTLQPVYHTYNIFQVFGKKMYVINDDNVPTLNRYVNIVDISTVDVEDLPDSQQADYHKFYKKQQRSVQKDFAMFLKENNIFPYIESSGLPAYVSLYKDRNTF